MEEAFILSDFSLYMKNLIQELKIPEKNIISLQTFGTESELHDWTKQLFMDNKIDKLIIPISIPTDKEINTEGLKIALHIRLNYELNLFQRLIPIILLSDFNVEKILAKFDFDSDNNPQYLLFTKGIYLSSFDIEEISNTVEKAEPCQPKNYQKQVLKKLKIFPKASTGKHSISNAWGCYKLVQVTGFRDVIFEHDAISGHLKNLYSKYLICYNDTFTQEKRIDLAPIKCNGKKILFIDDQTDEGWGILMKNIFKSAENNFVFIDSAEYKNKETKQFHNFEGFLTKCRFHIGNDWDLIIIDLRLNPEKEDIDNEIVKPDEFSGYKLIDEFLNENEGYQIMVSTASNKIWNINAALERGVSSYYIKESPEFNYSVNETKNHFENFKTDVQKCFNRSYLRDIYKDLKQIYLTIDNLPAITYNKDFKESLKNQLDLSYYLLSMASKNDSSSTNCLSSEKTKGEKQFGYAFISLCIIIEIINNEFITQTTDNKWEIKDCGNLLDWKWDDKSSKYINSGVYNNVNKPPEWQKFAGIYFQKWKRTDDHNFIKQLYLLINKRNGFVHNDKSILDKQDKNGNFLNHDIFSKKAYEDLFLYVKDIIGYLQSTTTAHI